MPDDAPSNLAREVVALCEDLGFAAAGVCDARPSDHADELREWIADGRHGSMDWLAQNVETRIDPALLTPGARSIVMVADVYHPRDGSGSAEPPQPGRGRVARYAQGDDYHKVMKARLHRLADALRERFPDDTFRTCVDTAPLLEREHAMRAGLGWTAKHTLLIHPRLGSYLLLGAIVTTLKIEPPNEQQPVIDHCGTCTRCIDACPTDAITPYSVDASRCISELTIERREAIPTEFHPAIGDWVFGCDICQEVCPHNSRRESPTPRNDAYAPRNASFDLLKLLGWSDADRSAALTRSSIKRARLDMLRRNAIIAAANQIAAGAELPQLRERIASIAQDQSEPELVRQTAREAVARLPLP